MNPTRSRRGTRVQWSLVFGSAGPRLGYSPKRNPEGILPPGSRPSIHPGSRRTETSRMQSTAYADPILLSTHADQSLLYRSSAALRMLRLMQSWAANHIVEPGRGLVWIARDWLRDQIGVSRSQYFRALARLRNSGWIVASTVADSSGQERPGYRVALASSDGFATAMRPRCDLDATHMRPKCDPPTLKLNQENTIEGKAAMTRDTRQSNLPGSHFDTPVSYQGQTKQDGAPRRDDRLKVVAARVDEYERARYMQHPRCVRPKRDTPEAHDISVEAITRALERVVASGSHSTLEDIETQFRAVVELNWEAADRKAETWDWWTGTAMWAPRSLDRVLGWLEEKRNWIYLERAAGRSSLPSRPDDTGRMPDDVSEMTPAEQQAAYDQAHGLVRGVDPSLPGSDRTGVFIEYRDGVTEGDLRDLHRKVSISIGGHELQGFKPDQPLEFPAEDPNPSENWRRWASMPSVQSPGYAAARAEWDAMEQLSDAVERGDAPDMAKLMDELALEFQMPRTIMFGEPVGGVSSDDELRRIRDRKSAYMKSTTPEERAADAKAGRQPWEGGSDA